MKTVLFFMTSLAVAAAMPVAAASKTEATVVVRTYDYANVSSDQLAAARAEADTDLQKRAHRGAMDRLPRARQAERRRVHRAAVARTGFDAEAGRPDAGECRRR